MKNFLKNLACDERGQDLVEYALMAGFVAVAAVAIMPGCATSVKFVLARAWAGLNSLPAPVVPASMDASMWRIGAAVLAVLFLGVIVLRRKKSTDY